jgi:hypothetical protein
LAFVIQVILGIAILVSGITSHAVLWEILGGLILFWAATMAMLYRRSSGTA